MFGHGLRGEDVISGCDVCDVCKAEVTFRDKGHKLDFLCIIQRVWLILSELVPQTLKVLKVVEELGAPLGFQTPDRNHDVISIM